MIGAALRRMRKKRGLSLRELGRLSGLSHSFICDIEHERCNPSIANLKALAIGLDEQPDVFLASMFGDNDHADGAAA